MDSKVISCKQHGGQPIQLFCNTCSTPICVSCVPLHLAKGCKELLDLPTYAKTHLVSKLAAMVAGAGAGAAAAAGKEEEKKGEAPAAGNLQDLSKSLATLCATMGRLLDQAKVAMVTLQGCAGMNLAMGDMNKKAAAQMLTELTSAIEQNDSARIVRAIEFVNSPALSKSSPLEEALSAATSLATSTAFPTLERSLASLVETCQKATRSDRYPVAVTGRHVYGLADNVNNAETLCRYDIVTNEFTQLMSVPRYCAIVQVEDRVFLTGGGEEATNGAYEYLDASRSLAVRSPLQNGRFEHSSVALSVTRFAVVGGRDQRHDNMNSCEVYSIPEDKWNPLPSLLQPRSYPGLCMVDSMHLYCIGGGGGNYDPVEMLDLSLTRGWVNIAIGERQIGCDRNIAVFPESRDQIIIMTNSKESGRLDLKAKVIVEYQWLGADDGFECNPMCMIGADKIYIMGSHCGNLHSYSLSQRKFAAVMFGVDGAAGK